MGGLETRIENHEFRAAHKCDNIFSPYIDRTQRELILSRRMIQFGQTKLVLDTHRFLKIGLLMERESGAQDLNSAGVSLDLPHPNSAQHRFAPPIVSHLVASSP